MRLPFVQRSHTGYLASKPSSSRGETLGQGGVQEVLHRCAVRDQGGPAVGEAVQLSGFGIRLPDFRQCVTELESSSAAAQLLTSLHRDALLVDSLGDEEQSWIARKDE